MKDSEWCCTVLPDVGVINLFMSNIYMWARGRLYLFYFFQKHEILQSFYEVLFFTRPSRKGALQCINHWWICSSSSSPIITIIWHHHHFVWTRNGWGRGNGGRRWQRGSVCVLKITSFTFYSGRTANAVYFLYSDTQHDMIHGSELVKFTVKELLPTYSKTFSLLVTILLYIFI